MLRLWHGSLICLHIDRVSGAQVFDEAHKAKNLINLRGELCFSLQLLTLSLLSTFTQPGHYACCLAKRRAADHGRTTLKSILEACLIIFVPCCWRL